MPAVCAACSRNWPRRRARGSRDGPPPTPAVHACHPCMAACHYGDCAGAPLGVNSPPQTRNARGETMRKLFLSLMLSMLAMPAFADEPLVLRGMGSFHVGGRIAEVNGKETRMITRVPGGPPSKYDPNGLFMVEQMYVQYFLPQNRKGKLPMLMWRGGGLT